MDSTKAITPDTMHNLSVSQIVLCDAAEWTHQTQTNPLFDSVVEANSLFFTSDDPAQNFVLVLIFKQIRASLNMSLLICFCQLMRHSATKLVHEVYATHSEIYGHGINV